MKTSNKLLVILLINLVLIPTTIMLALSAKVKSGKYVLGMTEYEKEARAAKPISATGLLKLTAPKGPNLNALYIILTACITVNMVLRIKGFLLKIQATRWCFPYLLLQPKVKMRIAMKSILIYLCPSTAC